MYSILKVVLALTINTDITLFQLFIISLMKIASARAVHHSALKFT